MHTIKTLFLHHSTGANLLNEGNVRKLLARLSPEIELWDHGYSLSISQLQYITSKFAPHLFSLTKPNGEPTGVDYGSELNNTDPIGYYRLFDKSENDPKTALNKILEYNCIIFKSCYPVSKIISKIQLNDYKKYYLSIRNKIDRYPHILFILFTPPPLRASLTNKNYAKRAGFFSKWLISKDYISKRRNIKIFDFFSLLAEDLPIEKTYNTLREKYCRTNYFDSHPNRRANEEIGEIFTNFLFQSVRDFFSF